MFCIKVLEDWAMPASYDLGLETERAALERLETELVQQEQVTFIFHRIKGFNGGMSDSLYNSCNKWMKWK